VNSEQQRAFDFVSSLRDYFGRYHADKEREAYFIALAYLGATAAFLTRDPAPIFLVGISLATLVAGVLVIFQLCNRWLAARMVATCTTIAARWLREPPGRHEYRPTRLGRRGYSVPAAVVQELQHHPVKSAFAAAIFVPLFLLLWGLLVICASLKGRVVLLFLQHLAAVLPLLCR
jgi:hypothetical protein